MLVIGAIHILVVNANYARLRQQQQQQHQHHYHHSMMHATQTYTVWLIDRMYRW